MAVGTCYPENRIGTRACKHGPMWGPEIRNAGGNGDLMLLNLLGYKCLSVVQGPPGTFSELRGDLKDTNMYLHDKLGRVGQVAGL